MHYKKTDIHSITVDGITAVVDKIIGGDIYGDDIIIEFTDNHGLYRNYHSDCDGGTVVMNDGTVYKYERK